MYLNVRSYYSLCFGTVSIEGLVEQACRMHIPALALTDISRMFFTNTKDATAIADITTIADDGEATVFDLAGRLVAEGRMQDVKTQLRKGVYIVKLNSKTLKVQVK